MTNLINLYRCIILASKPVKVSMILSHVGRVVKREICKSNQMGHGEAAFFEENIAGGRML
jgi:hypothetical protein